MTIHQQSSSVIHQWEVLALEHLQLSGLWICSTWEHRSMKYEIWVRYSLTHYQSVSRSPPKTVGKQYKKKVGEDFVHLEKNTGKKNKPALRSRFGFRIINIFFLCSTKKSQIIFSVKSSSDTNCKTNIVQTFLKQHQTEGSLVGEETVCRVSMTVKQITSKVMKVS